MFLGCLLLQHPVWYKRQNENPTNSLPCCSFSPKVPSHSTFSTPFRVFLYLFCFIYSIWLHLGQGTGESTYAPIFKSESSHFLKNNLLHFHTQVSAIVSLTIEIIFILTELVILNYMKISLIFLIIILLHLSDSSSAIFILFLYLIIFSILGDPGQIS